MDKLKPCPFCGGEAMKMTSSDGFTSIGCLECNPVFGVMVQAMTEAEAIKAWNTRAERTCTIEHRRDEYVCTACGNAVGDDDPWSENFVNGNAVEMWAYCPHCGAKVIGGDAE